MAAEETLQGFRKAQRLSYACATTIAREIRPGWTEKQTAKLMDTYLRDHGVKSFFHKSFAWFGNRTCFYHFNSNLAFMPKNIELKEDDVIILDTAPFVDGYIGDTGFVFSLKPNVQLNAARQDLLRYRELILNLFKSSKQGADIWKAIDDDFREKKFFNCHEQYPFGVLGHKVYREPLTHLPGITIPFSLQGMWSILKRGLKSELLSKDHKDSKIGFWAIEPHVGKKTFGAKFEEILVVEEDNVYWLDDEVPHLKLPEGVY